MAVTITGTVSTPTVSSTTIIERDPNTPLYKINDVVYLRESAALGFLEAVRISGISKINSSWLYTVHAGRMGAIAPTHFGDRISMTQGNILNFTEDEFVSEYDAMALSQANLQRQLDKIKLQKDTKYPLGGTTTIVETEPSTPSASSQRAPEHYVQDVKPTSARANDLWYNTTNGILYVFYDDGTSTQWVQIKG